MAGHGLVGQNKDRQGGRSPDGLFAKLAADVALGMKGAPLPYGALVRPIF